MVPVHAPGFVGSKNLGSRLGGEAVLAHLIGTAEPAFTTDFDINLIGDYNVTGDMWQYTPLLEELGIRVLATLSGDGRVAAIRTAHRARLNVLVCAKSLVSLTRKMEERYGIPSISLSFYGKRDTSAGLLAIATALGDADLVARTRALIAREEAQLEARLAPYRALFTGKKAVLNTGGNKAWSIAAALQDLGIEVVATAVGKSTEDDREKARQYLGPKGVLMTKPGQEQAKIIDETKADLLLAGGRSLYTAIKKGIAFADVNQEKKKSYGGYAGLLNLAEDLKHALETPVFRNVGTEGAMGEVIHKSAKPLQVNPHKLSQPMGATLAFLGRRSLHAADARRPGVHLLHQGLLDPPLRRADRHPDHGGDRRHGDPRRRRLQHRRVR